MGKQTFNRTKETIGILLLVLFTVFILASCIAAAKDPDNYNCTTTTVCKCPCPYSSDHHDSGFGDRYNCGCDNQQKCCNNVCGGQKNENDFHDHDMFNCFNNFWVPCLENNNRLMLFEITFSTYDETN